MSDVVDWMQAAVAWTEDGYELSVPMNPAVTPRQARAIADAVEQAVHQACGESIEVGFVGPELGTSADLLITTPTLLAVDPALLRRVTDDAALRAANETLSAENQRAPQIAGWLHALQAAR